MPSTELTDTRWAAEAVALAAGSVTHGGGPFGALVLRAGRPVASGTNLVTAELDPTAHAEITAIRAACRELGTFHLDGCVLVSSCEPCPMCLGAALWARLDRVVYAADRHDAARGGFDDRAFHDLFRHPEQPWPTRVRQVQLAERAAPFERWLAKADRVDY
ncbi:nucleoside deaminase [Saccharopolyspora sp. 6V]|uniref:nucleoside deaminase n=1 Tax=Saccharopolyspora sp. 6V TaxID=2877239 RepID=UPI001CD5740C|nr:nucleoside deaminase [Saccharopolyspora sp. 6V]MCA1195378.1 nucleoside deaminase [Saccharopolyspora sp. 6V]